MTQLCNKQVVNFISQILILILPYDFTQLCVYIHYFTDIIMVDETAAVVGVLVAIVVIVLALVVTGFWLVINS